MGGQSIDRRRAALAILAVVAAAPGLAFFAAAGGRLLQPTANEPARTLEAIFQAFAGLPGPLLVALVAVGPFVALVLGAYVVIAEWRDSPAARADARAAAVAVGRLARHGAFVVGALVGLAGAAMVALLVAHAIAG